MIWYHVVKRSFKNYPVAHLFLKLPLLFLPCISISVQTPNRFKNTFFSPINLLHLTCQIRDNFISWTPHSYHTMEMRAIIWEDILKIYVEMLFSSVQSLSRVWLFATPWITACQASLSITNSQSSPQTHVHRVSDAILPSPPLSSPLLLPPSPPSIRVF